LEEILHQQ